MCKQWSLSVFQWWSLVQAVQVALAKKAEAVVVATVLEVAGAAEPRLVRAALAPPRVATRIHAD